jgi:citrate lyase subunit beta/citryl-CoA lyase
VATPYRTLYFVPAHDEGRIRNAFASSADAVVCDLEDATPSTEKAAARQLLKRVLPDIGGGPAKLVRVNAASTRHLEDDLHALAGLDLDGIVLPKADVAAAERLGPDGPLVIAVVETARGLREAYELAGVPRVKALVLGAVDLAISMGLEPREDAQELLYARSKLVVDSLAAGLRPPLDRVWVGGDLAGLEADCRFARSLGLRGKACTQAAHLEVINAVFGESGTTATDALKHSIYGH